MSNHLVRFRDLEREVHKKVESMRDTAGSDSEIRYKVDAHAEILYRHLTGLEEDLAIADDFFTENDPVDQSSIDRNQTNLVREGHIE